MGGERQSSPRMTGVIPSPAQEPDAVGVMEPHTDPTPPRDPFADFRADHARVLLRLEQVEQCVLRSPARELDQRPLEQLVEHLGRQFTTHMAAEDQVLFPALALALPEVVGTLAPLRADHIELRGMLDSMTRLLAGEWTGPRDEQLRVLTRDLVDLLRLHVRKEESVVFELASRVLSPDELAALGHRLTPYLRTHHDGADERREGKVS